eukprot:7204349-Pyramimonas_sp.AAC.1
MAMPPHRGQQHIALAQPPASPLEARVIHEDSRLHSEIDSAHLAAHAVKEQMHHRVCVAAAS